MLGYLNITGLEVALLLNFKESTLTWKRVVREDGGQKHQAQRSASVKSVPAEGPACPPKARPARRRPGAGGRRRAQAGAGGRRQARDPR